MFTWLFGLTLACAVVDWLASWRNWRQVRWITKPATLILLIGWYLQMGGWHGDLVFFTAGLFFSLLGDILLLFPARFFLAGVGAFFLAHVAYIAGFWQLRLVLDVRLLLPLLLVAAAYGLLVSRILAGLRQSNEYALAIPVAAYAAVLSLMWLSALSTLFRPTWTEPPAALASLGASLFFLSDAVLAYNRFVRSLRAADLLVMVTYHLGQILIAVGTLGQYVGLL